MLTNNSNKDIKIKFFGRSFYERNDFNWGDITPRFEYTDWIKNKNLIVSPSKSWKIIKSTNTTIYNVLYYLTFITPINLK